MTAYDLKIHEQYFRNRSMLQIEELTKELESVGVKLWAVVPRENPESAKRFEEEESKARAELMQAIKKAHTEANRIYSELVDAAWDTYRQKKAALLTPE